MKQLLILLVLLTACQPTMSLVGPGEFAEIIEREEVFVLDARSPEQEHIPGTDTYLPHDDLWSHQDELPSLDTPIAVYCLRGPRSEMASQTLLEMGYKEIYQLEGGITAWQEAGYPVE